jgi:hypothetical protein
MRVVKRRYPCRCTERCYWALEIPVTRQPLLASARHASAERRDLNSGVAPLGAIPQLDSLGQPEGYCPHVDLLRR